MRYNAFTMVEMIAVLVIISILSLILIPHFQPSKLQEAAYLLQKNIEYTRHLALIDDPYAKNDFEYFKKYWQIVFAKSAYTNNAYTYSIFKDTSGGNTGNPDISELATNPSNPKKLMSGGYSGILKSNDARATSEMNLGEYGVVDVQFEGGCKYSTAKRIAFDELSRPMKGNLASTTRPYQRMVDSLCTIRLCGDTECSNSVSVIIEPYAGYSRIN